MKAARGRRWWSLEFDCNFTAEKNKEFQLELRGHKSQEWTAAALGCVLSVVLDENMSSLLFVYGTLKRGGNLHREIAEHGARFLGPAKIQGELFHVKGESWPGAFPTVSHSYVDGELYKLAKSAETLKRLDVVEGCKEGLFVRKLVDAWTGNRKFKAWVYFFNCEERKASRIVSGNFSTEQQRSTHAE